MSLRLLTGPIIKLNERLRDRSEDLGAPKNALDIVSITSTPTRTVRLVSGRIRRSEEHLQHPRTRCQARKNPLMGPAFVSEPR